MRGILFLDLFGSLVTATIFALACWASGQDGFTTAACAVGGAFLAWYGKKTVRG